MDCYLCGAHNSAEADICERCNGQLLKIGLDPAPEPEEIVAPAPDILEEPAPASGNRVESLKSVEHRRLSAALGLGKPDTPPPRQERPRPIDQPPERSASASGVPTASSAKSIPMIGTRTASFDTAPMRESSDPGRKTAIALVILAAVVGWFGYGTLSSEPVEVAPPAELAFASTTRPITATTTTEPPVRAWTENEVLGKFSSVFVTVELNECPAEIVTGKETTISDWRTPGVLIDEHNVVFDGAELQGATIGLVRSRIGSETIGRLSSHESGLGVVTSSAASNRNMKISEEPQGEAMFWVTLDPETNGIIVSTDPLRSTGEAVIEVSSQGDPLQVEIGPQRASSSALQQIATRETTVVDSLSLGSSICADAPTYVDSAVAATLAEEVD